jgi:predicted transcriptional regulator of viral defense system
MAKLFNADRLRAALEAEDEPALGQRLGFMLENAGHSKIASVVRRWLPRYVQWTLLEPGTLSKAGEKIQRWKLIKTLEPTHTAGRSRASNESPMACD